MLRRLASGQRGSRKLRLCCNGNPHLVRHLLSRLGDGLLGGYADGALGRLRQGCERLLGAGAGVDASLGQLGGDAGALGPAYMAGRAWRTSRQSSTDKEQQGDVRCPQQKADRSPGRWLAGRWPGFTVPAGTHTSSSSAAAAAGTLVCFCTAVMQCCTE